MTESSTYLSDYCKKKLTIAIIIILRRIAAVMMTSTVPVVLTTSINMTVTLIPTVVLLQQWR